MRKVKLLTVSAALIFAGPCWLLMLGASPGEGGRTGEGRPYIKLGNTYINMDHVDYVTVEGDGVRVAFQNRDSLGFQGQDARALREWLIRHVVAPIETPTDKGDQKPANPAFDYSGVGNEGFRNLEKRTGKGKEND